MMARTTTIKLFMVDIEGFNELLLTQMCAETWFCRARNEKLIKLNFSLFQVLGDNKKIAFHPFENVYHAQNAVKSFCFFTPWNSFESFNLCIH